MVDEDERESDISLLRLAVSNDRKALRTLYDRYARDVFLYCLSIVRLSTDAEEAAQETWLALWAGRKKIQLQSETLLPWLLVTARHKSLHLLQRSAKHSTHTTALDENEDFDAHLGAVTSGVEFVELQQHIEAVIRRLPQLDQAIYRLCVVDNKSYADAGRELGISDGALRNRLSRLKGRLRASIQEIEN